MADIREGMQQAHEKLTLKVYIQRDFAGGYVSPGDIVDYTETTERSIVTTTTSEKGFRRTSDAQVDVETPKWDLTLQEGNDTNEILRRLGIKNTDISQASGTGTTASFDAVVEGQYYSIGSFDITNVVVAIDAGATGVLNTDYTIDTGSGMLYIIPGGIFDGEDIIATFNRPALTFESFTSTQQPMFQGNVIMEEYNQLDDVPLRRLTFQGQIIITAFPAQTGEFGRWTATVYATSNPAVQKRTVA